MQKKVESTNQQSEFDDGSSSVDHKENEKIKSELTEFGENTNKCLVRLMRIIDYGLSKSYDSFLLDMNNILLPIRDSPTTKFGFGSFDIKNTPITSFRKYLRPSFEAKKYLFNEHEAVEDPILINDNDFNLWDLYTNNFKEVYNKYFSHFNEDILDDNKTKENKFKLRHKIYQDFKLKICLVEDERVLTSFLKQIIFFEEKVSEKRDNYENFEDRDKDGDIGEDILFWKKFFNDVAEFEPKFKIYLLPMNNPIDEKNQNPHLYETSMLSEYLASKDYIYQTLIYNSWMAHKENFEFTRHKGKYLT